MTESHMTPMTWPAKVTSSILAVGIIVMFGVSLKERLVNPSLVVDNGPSAAANSGASGMGDMDPEVGILMQALQQNPEDTGKMLHLAELLIEDEQWDAAETFIHRALSLKPDSSQGHYLHGIVLNNAGRHKEAVEALEQVIRLDDSASVRYSLGILNIHYLDKKAEGVAHLQKGLEDKDAPGDLIAAIRKELENVAPEAPKAVDAVENNAQ